MNEGLQRALDRATPEMRADCVLSAENIRRAFQALDQNARQTVPLDEWVTPKLGPLSELFKGPPVDCAPLLPGYSSYSDNDGGILIPTEFAGAIIEFTAGDGLYVETRTISIPADDPQPDAIVDATGT